MLNLPDNQVTAVVLGIMQDAGLPHAGCHCRRCTAALADPACADYAACLGLVDTRPTQPLVYLIDATPDIKYQLEMLSQVLGQHPQRPGRLRQPDGIFLTHAHMGHIAGLPQLSFEAMYVTDMPLFVSQPLGQLLLRTELWSPLTQNLRIVPLVDGQSLDLAADLQITALSVPHRDEWDAGTFAFHIQGPRHSLLYLPDIDAWQQWPTAAETIDDADYALIDGSFYSREELGGRQPVAHPLITDTVARFSDTQTALYFTHFNHTNPVLEKDSAERTAVLASPLHIAHTGLQLPL